VIVDDVRFTRATLAKMLAGLGGPKVHEAEDGEGALKLLGQLGSAVDCVISDLEMPRLDGLGLLQAIRVGTGAIRRELPLVMVTGHSEFERLGAALLLDVDAFITKPVSKSAIESCLAKVLGDAAAHRPLAAPHVYRRVDQSGAAVAAEPPENDGSVAERCIELAEVGDGTQLARDLMFSNGRLLLPAHTRLNARTVQLLHDVATVSTLPREVWIVA
jgi:two-component system, chemotaxis family, chemotaxis protein CheY